MDSNNTPYDNPYQKASSPYGSPPAPSLPPVEPPLKRQNPDKDGFSGILSTILILVAAPLIALFLTAFVFQSYEVDGPSMQNTLHDSDRLVVVKTAKTWANITNKAFVPERGEIIVFTQNEGISNERQLIKRVIGLPGEHVVGNGSDVTVYNTEHPGGFDPDDKLPYGENTKQTKGNVDITVPAGEVFVLGDNRENSQDSRNFGTVPSDAIVGTLYLRLLPISKARTF